MSRRRKFLAGALLGQALRGVMRHKTRSSLTALGIAVGIAAVVWVVAVGRAGSERAEAQLTALGDNLIWVEAGARNVAGVRTGTRGMNTLTVEDVEAIRREVPTIKSVSPNIDGSVLLVHGNRNWTSHFRGVSPDYLSIKRWTLSSGGAFSDDAVNGADNVCLIGETVRQQLFGSEDPVGQVVRIGAQPFEVVGLLAPKGQSASGQDQDDTVMMPFTTARNKIRGRGITWLDDILCSAVTPEAVALAAKQIEELLRERHHIEVDAEDDFNIRHPEEIVKAQLAASETLARLLISIASVALLVGGVGVMNVMLASVAERTQEIGLRLAVGATPGAVQGQFLGEAVVLSLLGGLAGVLLSVVGSFALGRTLGWRLTIPPQALAIALAFSVAVGVVFGFYPARRAARLDPIEALRRD
jgi:putative ABC transport system permease protein